jgi:hypothetical protein
LKGLSSNAWIVPEEAERVRFLKKVEKNGMQMKKYRLVA